MVKWFNKLRWKLFWWLKKDIFKIPEGAEHPWYFLIIRCLIFPHEWLDWIVWSREQKIYSFYSKSYFVNKVEFSYEFLYSLVDMKVGDSIKIKKYSEEFPYFELTNERR